MQLLSVRKEKAVYPYQEPHQNRKMAGFQTGSNSFHALLCVDGCGVLIGEDIMLNFFKGDCIFVPADSIAMKLHGKAQLLDVSC